MQDQCQLFNSIAFLTHDSNEGVSEMTGVMFFGKYLAVVCPMDIALKLLSQDIFLKKHSIVEGEEKIIVEFLGSFTG